MSHVPIEVLLAHSDWVRRLAAELTGDPALADDLVQETWASALRRGPRDAGSPRAWLATLLRRHLRQFRRGEGRRAAREGQRARSSLEEPSAADVVEKAERHHRLAAAVLRLREPYRSTLLERYFEDRSVEEIAHRAQLPVSTVSSRLTRGLARLREALGRRERGGFPLFVPFLRPSHPRWRRLSPRWLRGSARLWGTLAAAVAVASWTLGSSGERVAGRLRGEDRAPVRPSGSSLRFAGSPETRIALQGPAGAKRLESSAPPVVQGLILDVDGHAVAGVTLGLEQNEEPLDGEVCVSDAQGRFALPSVAEATAVSARDPRYVTLLVGLLGEGRSHRARVLVAPARALSGRVRDEDGRPIEGADLVWLVDHLLPVSYEYSLDFTEPRLWFATTDVGGRYTFPNVPGIEASRLKVMRTGFEPVLIPYAAFAGDGDITLARPVASHGRVRGTVVDGRGRPVEGATVALAPCMTLSDAHGAFDLPLSSPPASATLAAAKPGVGAAGLPWSASEPASAEPVVLRLGDSPGVVEGRVLDARGLPTAGARVWLADPTVLGFRGRGLVLAESEALGRGGPSWDPVVCDEAGRFRLEGLLDREYHVTAMDEHGRCLAASGPVQAGEVLELQLSDPGLLAAISGRVIDGRGLPVSGVQVTRVRRIQDVSWGELRLVEDFPDVPVRTDAQGRFQLGRFDPADSIVRLRSDSILPGDFAVPGSARDDGWVLPVFRRAHLQVQLSEPHDRADAFEVLDETGERLTMIQLRESCSHPHDRAELVEGRSLVLAVPDAASTVVLLRDGNEVARLPLALAPGRTETVRW